MNSKKINWILILQGWAMFWVVIGHSVVGSSKDSDTWPLYIYYLFWFAYSFHMALFMFVSGYLFQMTRLCDEKSSRWTYKSIIIDKTKRLLIPGILFSLFAFALKIAFPDNMARPVGLSLYDILHVIFYPIDNPLREMWFIATLFWMFLLSPLWKWSLGNNNRSNCTIAFLILLHFIPQLKGLEFLCIGRFCSFALWFYLGLVCCQKKFVEGVIQNNTILLLISSVLLYIIGIFYFPFFKTAGGILGSIVLALILDKYLPSTFKGFRDYTYQIFLIGIFVQILFKHLLAGTSQSIVFVCCIISGLYVPVIISLILKRIDYYPLLFCLGLKK